MPTTFQLEPQRSVVALDLSPASSGIFTPGIESIVLADDQLDRFNALARLLADDQLDRFNALARLLDPSMPALTGDQVAAVARRVLRTAAAGGQSPFIASRLRRAAEMRALRDDAGWTLGADLARRVDALLAYIEDPDVLIPDAIPVIGRLDDALLVDFAMDALRDELDDYSEFCRYRRAEAARDGGGDGIDRSAWEQARADELRLEQQLRRSRNGHYGNGAAERLFRVC